MTGTADQPASILHVAGRRPDGGVRAPTPLALAGALRDYRAVRTLTQPMLDAIRAARSPEELRAALESAAADTAPMAHDLESAGLAASLDVGENGK